MTNPATPIILTYSSAELNERIMALLGELSETAKDLGLMRRLKAAEEKADRLTGELEDAQRMLPDILAAEQVAYKKALYAGIHSISVHTVKPDESVLSSPYSITVKRVTSDTTLTNNILQDHIFNGFDAMPQETFSYLVEMQPSAIPAKIMALAPDDPAAAFNLYFAGKRRGYLSA